MSFEELQKAFDETKTEDNPIEDFRSMSVFPTVDDLYDKEPFIRPAKIKEAYDSVEQYLDVQFRLLRQDFLSPLRKGLDEYLNGGFRYRNNDLRVYKNVELSVPAHVNKNNRVGIKVFFGVLNHVRWHDSKRFMHGGLLLLSSDNFDTVIFATVVDRDEKDLKEGYVLIEPIEETVITPKMYKTKYVMLESKIFFEPYKSVLSAMKLMNEDRFPMKNYLAFASKSTQLPAYFKGVNVFDENIEENREWIEEQRLSLDESQFDAYKHALTEEFALIQGPPGTGKTYIALEIVRTLLACKRLWLDYGPIVVVCYTNHALDQFLEGIQNHTKSIVRIGDRSKSEKLTPFTLKEKRRGCDYERMINFDARRDMFDVKNDLQGIMTTLAEVNFDLKFLTHRTAVVPLECLLKYCYDPTLSRLESNEKLLEWLLEEDLSLCMKKFETDENVDNVWENINENDENLFENIDETFEVGEQFNADDDLDFKFEFTIPDGFKLIFPLQMIDEHRKKILQEINFSRCNLLHPEHSYFVDQQNYIATLEDYCERLNAKYLFVQVCKDFLL